MLGYLKRSDGGGFKDIAGRRREGQSFQRGKKEAERQRGYPAMRYRIGAIALLFSFIP